MSLDVQYSLVSKAFRVFNTRRQQTEETYHIIFDESPDAIKFTKPLDDNIDIAKSERYPPYEYLHPYNPSQRLEAIRVYLAFATYMNFIVYQMDVKSAFLNGKLKEEVYVKQPLGFERSKFPNHVCKLAKPFMDLNKLQEHGYQANPKESQLIVVKRIFRDHILKGDIGLHFIPTQYQLADIFTKTLDEPTFKRLIVELEGSKIWVSIPTRGIREETGVNTFKNAIRANYSNEYVASPSLTIIRPWFSSTGYNGEIWATRTLKKSCLPPRKSSHTSQPLDCNVLPYNSSTDNGVSGCVRLAMVEVIKGYGRCFFHFHSDSASGCDALADSTAEADPGISAPNDFIPEQQDQTKSTRDGLKTTHTGLGTNKESKSDEISKKIKLEDPSNIMQDIRSAFLTPDSPQDEPIIILDESENEKTERYKDTYTTSYDGPKDTLIPHPPSTKSVQIQELMAQVAELKTIQWELPAKFLVLPNQISLVQEKLKTLDALPSILNKVTITLNRFASLINQSSKKAKDKGVPSAGKSNASPAEGEENTYSAAKEENLKNDLVDLMGIDAQK
ncbi:retrovirus-related pol polyprotein from transposon TNT 1-94 [Tanacetum coccineum]